MVECACHTNTRVCTRSVCGKVVDVSGKSQMLYSMNSGDDAPRVPRGLVLVSALPGVIDAGQVCDVTSTYLHDSLEHRRVVTFDADEIVDYRASRPLGRFDGRGFSINEVPEVAIELMWDERGEPFLFLFGPEPDLRWKAMSEALIDVCEVLGVRLHVSIRSVPAEVPHTRLVSMVPHANGVARANDRHEAPDSEPLEVPVSFSAFAEVAMEAAEISSRGFVAQVPHYLARSSFPAAVLALLRRVSESAQLQFPLTDLGEVVSVSSKVIESDVRENGELSQHVEVLEKAYDSVRAQSGEGDRTVLDTPTAEEIGASLEKFLQETARDEEE